MRCGAEQRKQLEHLCRYITCPAIANERLKRNSAGQVVLQLKSAYKDITTQVVMSPLEFMQRLAALVPRPRLHLIRFHGVLAPNAKLRAAIVPPPAHSTHAAEHAHHSPARMTWSRLLKRVFDIDIEHCSNCGGAFEDHRRHRRAASDSQNPRPFGFAYPGAAALTCAPSRVAGLGPLLPSGLRAESACPTQGDDRARPALGQTPEAAIKPAPHTDQSPKNRYQSAIFRAILV